MTEFAASWLLLLHQIPPKPAYFRAKVQRRLKRIGALQVKNSAYLLPATDENLEDFQWLVREVQAEGGEAWLFTADVIAGFTGASLERQFTDRATEEYRELSADAGAVLDRVRSESAGELELADSEIVRKELQRLRRRWDEIGRRDHFHAPAAEEVRTMMNEIEQSTKRAQGVASSGGERSDGTDGYQARTWVTRRDVKIDRIASAWLIRRFIDPAARFLFVDGTTHDARSGELRFDMFDGEFTHRGASCTFEVLVADVAVHDPALGEIAEIVHDIDLKDDLFGRPEAIGIAAVIDGLILSEPEDARRIEKGSELFDGLYERLRQDRGSS